MSKCSTFDWAFIEPFDVVANFVVSFGHWRTSSVHKQGNMKSQHPWLKQTILGNFSSDSCCRSGSTISFSTLIGEAWSSCPNTPNNWEDSLTISILSFGRPEAMATGKRLFNLLHLMIISWYKLGKHKDWRSLPDNISSFSKSVALAMICSNSSQFNISRTFSWTRLAIMLSVNTCVNLLHSFTTKVVKLLGTRPFHTHLMSGNKFKCNFSKLTSGSSCPLLLLVITKRSTFIKSCTPKFLIDISFKFINPCIKRKQGYRFVRCNS